MGTRNFSDETENLRATISIAGFVILPTVPNPVLLKDMKLPAEAIYVFSNQTKELPQGGHSLMTIELFFGDNRLGSDNVSLGDYLLEGIRPVPGGPEQIEIKASVSVDQILHIALMDHVTRKYRTVGFIDLSDIEVPEIVPEPEHSTTNVGKLYYEQVSNLFLDPQTREEARPRRGNGISHKLTISLEEAICGTRKNVKVVSAETCTVCAGNGARPGTAPAHCIDCQGTGWKKQVEETDEGPLWRGKTCPSCDGDGLIVSIPCPNCRGRTLVNTTRSVTARIPPLIDLGAQVRLPCSGQVGRYGGPRGHLNINVTIARHPFLTRVDRDVSVDLPVSASFAKKGGQVRVPGIEKGQSFLLNLPPDTSGGMAFRVYESEAYTLTATIDTYSPSLLFLMPEVKKRLQAIGEALDCEDFELEDSPNEAGAGRAVATDWQEQHEEIRGQQVQGIPGPPQTVGRSREYAEFYTRRGAISAKRGNQARALVDYNKALELNPDYAPAYDNRSLVHMFRNDPEQALADLNKALALDPNNAEYYGHRGTVYCFQGDSVLALADYDKALGLDPNNVEVYHSRGKLYASQKDLTNALSDYDKALQLDPNNAAVYYCRGTLYASQKDVAMALADYDKALEMDPAEITLYRVLDARYQVHLYQNNLEKALADIDKAVEMTPNNARAYNNRGYVYFLGDDLDSALADYDKALELDPNLVPACNYRGRAYLKQACYEQAVEDFEKSLSLHPGDMYVCLWLGQAYQGAGERDKAAALFRQVLETSQDPELRQEARKHLEELRQQKRRMVRIRICPECGKHSPVSVWECSNCGQTLSLDTIVELDSETLDSH